MCRPAGCEHGDDRDGAEPQACEARVQASHRTLLDVGSEHHVSGRHDALHAASREMDSNTRNTGRTGIPSERVQLARLTPGSRHALLAAVGEGHRPRSRRKAESDLTAALMRAAPQGIDVYFENVGGAHMEAALMAARPFGRFALCGMISQYNATDMGAGVRGLIVAVGKQLRLEGFIVSSHNDMMPAFVKDLAGWVTEGKIKWRETVEEGIERAPDAFLKLFKGENLGKMLVRLG